METRTIKLVFAIVLLLSASVVATAQTTTNKPKPKPKTSGFFDEADALFGKRKVVTPKPQSKQNVKRVTPKRSITHDPEFEPLGKSKKAKPSTKKKP